MNKEIYDAIKEMKVIKFDYEGYQRIVQPHTYGVHKDTGNEVLRAYQIGGYSTSGQIPGWRLFVVDKISNVIITEERFENPAPGYKENDSAMSIIYRQL